MLLSILYNTGIIRGSPNTEYYFWKFSLISYKESLHNSPDQ